MVYISVMKSNTKLLTGSKHQTKAYEGSTVNPLRHHNLSLHHQRAGLENSKDQHFYTTEEGMEKMHK